MKQVIATLFFLLAATAIIFYVLYPGLKKKPEAKITNFKECVAAGYPVKDYYPRECDLPNNKYFLEQEVKAR